MLSFITQDRKIVCFVLMLGLSLGGLPGSATAQHASTFPVLTSAVTISAVPDSIMVSGDGFTHGGLVHIVLHDQWGKALHETRWVTASVAAYQPPQDLAPGQGFSFDTGGNIAESFVIAVGATSQIPDGNQNPALNGSSGMLAPIPGSACNAAVMVRAFDQASAIWSNLLDVDLECAG
jgi:hypothetical protein